MGAASQESVVIKLAGGPAVEKAVQASQADGGSEDTGHPDLRGPNRPRCDGERFIGGHAVAGYGLVDVATDAAEANTKSVNQGRTKNMRLLGAGHLPSRKNLMNGVEERVRLGLWPRIEEVAGSEGVLVREFLVYAGGDVVFVGDRVERHIERLCHSVAVDRRACRSLGPKLQIGGDGRDRQSALCIGGNMNGLRAGLILANPFVGSVDECFVFDDSGAARAAELHAAEGRYRAGGVKVILGIKDFVPIKGESGTVQFVGAALGDRIDDGAGSAAILGGVVAGENGEFLDSVNAEVQAGSATGRPI